MIEYNKIVNFTELYVQFRKLKLETAWLTTKCNKIFPIRVNYHYTKQNKTKNQLIETRNAENDFPVRSCLSVNILYSKYTYDNAHLLSHLQIEFSLS